jgi:hypothetical protein
VGAALDVLNRRTSSSGHGRGSSQFMPLDEQRFRTERLRRSIGDRPNNMDEGKC